VESQRNCRSSGFSIVELLVATALIAILLSGVVAIFLASRNTYAATQRMADIQETGRRALDEIATAIRSSGVNGCSRDTAQRTSSLPHSDDLRWNFLDTAPVRGILPGASKLLMPPDVMPEGDVLLIRRFRPLTTPAVLISGMATPDASLSLAKSAQSLLKKGDVATIYDCQAQAFFVVSSVINGDVNHSAALSTDMPFNDSDALGYAFSPGAEVMPIETVIYYIAPDPSENQQPCLWRRVGNEPPQLIATDVERMQFLFNDGGTSAESTQDYKSADAIMRWQSVRSVAVSLLVRSARSASDSKSSLIKFPDMIADDDGYIRKVFNTVAEIRNRTT
jgi:type IV pilus assembly protein PilW